MQLEDFFSHLIDGYLLLDLKNMAAQKQFRGEKAGALGYPMIATLLPAMELLGGILQPNDYSDETKNGKIYFLYYWDNYLGKINKDYTNNLGEIFYNLIRHGTAHTFITKIGITATKRQPQNHLVPYTTSNGNQRLNVDCYSLYKDFKKSYTLVKKILRNQNNKIQVQKNINLLIEQSENKSKKVFDQYLPSQQVTSTSKSFTTSSDINNQTTTMIPDDVQKKLSQTFQSTAYPMSGASLITQESAKNPSNPNTPVKHVNSDK
jgi:hypothetical protein